MRNRLAALGFTLAAFTTQAATALEGKALIIGIDKYPYVNPLVGSAVDAGNMRAAAVDIWGFKPADVRVLLDEQATKAGILNGLDRWLVAGTKPGDTVLLYYSGHGFHVRDEDGDERLLDPNDDQDEALVAYDARSGTNGKPEGLVLDDEIALRLNRLKDRKVVMIFDSCHSGTMTRSLDEMGKMAVLPTAGVTTRGVGASTVGAPTATETVAAPVAPAATPEGEMRADAVDGAPNIVALFAVRPNQVALVHERLSPPQGVFTDSLLRGVRGAADANGNGVVSIAELEAFTRKESARYCSEKKGGCKMGLSPFAEAPKSVLGQELFTSRQAAAQQGGVEDVIVGPGEKVDILVTPPGPIRIGEKIEVTVTAPFEGTVILLDIGPDKKATLLYPNAHSERQHAPRRIAAGQTLRLPGPFGFKIHAQPPAGYGSVVALVVQDDIPLKQLERLASQAVASRGFAAVEDPYAFLGDLGKAMVIPWTKELETKNVKWGIGHVTYEIK